MGRPRREYSSIYIPQPRSKQLLTVPRFVVLLGKKVVSLVTSGGSSPFKIAGSAHPAMVNPEEAKSIQVPLRSC